jgi:hypothetical protein
LDDRGVEAAAATRLHRDFAFDRCAPNLAAVSDLDRKLICAPSEPAASAGLLPLSIWTQSCRSNLLHYFSGNGESSTQQ